MATSEDYTLIWAGIYRRLKDSPIDDDVASPLEVRARQARLQTWRDTFEIDPPRGDVPCLLIGRRVGLLGYKEGRTRFAMDASRVRSILATTGARLRAIGIRTVPRIHVLVHIEDIEC